MNFFFLLVDKEFLFFVQNRFQFWFEMRILCLKFLKFLLKIKSEICSNLKGKNLNVIIYVLRGSLLLLLEQDRSTSIFAHQIMMQIYFCTKRCFAFALYLGCKTLKTALVLVDIPSSQGFRPVQESDYLLPYITE